MWQEMFQNTSEQALKPGPQLQLLVFLQFSHLQQTFLMKSPQMMSRNQCSLTQHNFTFKAEQLFTFLLSKRVPVHCMYSASTYRKPPSPKYSGYKTHVCNNNNINTEYVYKIKYYFRRF